MYGTGRLFLRLGAALGLFSNLFQSVGLAYEKPARRIYSSCSLGFMESDVEEDWRAEIMTERRDIEYWTLIASVREYVVYVFFAFSCNDRSKQEVKVI